MFKPLRIAALLLASACGDNGPTEPDPAIPSSLEITPSGPSLAMGGTRQLDATVKDQRGQPMSLPPGLTVTWQSSDVARVTVTGSGLTRGVRVGAATIAATAGSLQATTSVTVEPAQIILEAGRAVSAQIGVQGGSIEALSSSGVLHRLEIPAFAMQQTTTITLTPVASIQNVPRINTLGAVKFSPDGLKLIGGALLHITLPSTAPPQTALAGFTFSDDGSQLAPSLVRRNGNTLIIPIHHFSGAGAGTTDGADAIPPPIESDPSVDAVIALANGDINDPEAATARLREWYNDGVKPALVAGEPAALVTDPSWLDAIDEWLLWLLTIEQVGATTGTTAQLTADLGPEINEARSLAAAVLLAAIADKNQRCIAEKDWRLAVSVAAVQASAAAWGLASEQYLLDEQTVRETLCVDVEILELTLANPLTRAVAEELIVRAGIGYGGQPAPDPPYANDELTIRWSITGVIEDGIGGDDLVNGGWSKILTPTGQADVTVNVVVCMPDIPLLASICADGNVIRQVGGLRVQPAEVTLGTGELQQFIAVFEGIPTEPVVWTATGGTIDNNGLYMAGDVTGNYRVVATSVADPQLYGEANVAIRTSSALPVIATTRSLNLSATASAGPNIPSDRQSQVADTYAPFEGSVEAELTVDGSLARASGSMKSVPTLRGDTLVTFEESGRLDVTATGHPPSMTASASAVTAANFSVRGESVRLTLTAECLVENPAFAANSKFNLSERQGSQNVRWLLVNFQADCESGSTATITVELTPGDYRLSHGSNPFASTSPGNPEGRSHQVTYSFKVTFQ